MKVGWVSASPTARTGYGLQTLEVCRRLKKKHEVVCMGQVGDPIVWGQRQEVDTPSGKLQVLSLTEPAGELLNSYYMPEFKFDVIVGFMDAFGLEYLNDVKAPVVFWIPIDGPFTSKWANYVRNGSRIVAYSTYGYGQLSQFFPPSRIAYVPHGLDTRVFRPLSEEDRVLARLELEEEYGVPRDAFLGIYVGANVGPRKHIPLLMHTWSRFVQDHKDAHLLIHTNAYAQFPRGYDLVTWRLMLGMENNVHFPTYDPILKPTPNEKLARIYAAGDVYVSNSCAEGFGLPLLEAMGCGLPCIAPRNSAQDELVRGRGWFVENVPEDDFFEVPVYVPMLTKYPAPSQRSLLQKLHEAYHNPDVRKEYGRKSRLFALTYSWDRVMPDWFKLLDQVEEELGFFKGLQDSLKG